jgi:uncharacterized protein (UPF0276 family)
MREQSASATLCGRIAAPIPASAGIGLRAPHYRALIENRPRVGWLEVHSENYFGAGGPPLAYLERLRQDYPLSLHGVGLSLGSTDPINLQHLGAIKRLVEDFEPGLVSEHLCWSSIGGIYMNDLLPLPYTEEALAHVVERVERTQDFLKRRILIENVSSYLRYHASTIPEWEFLVEVATRSDCGILLDVNNVYVSATNHEFDADEYLVAIPDNLVGEIHLAGFAVNRYPEGTILIDNHGARVADAVWNLFAKTIERLGQIPTLIEWDTDIPPLDVLLSEANKAQQILEGHLAVVA